MKTTVASFLLFCAAANADLVVEQKLESGFVNGSMILKIKGDQARMDMPSGGSGDVTVLMNTKTGDMATLVHGQKTALKMTLAAAKKRAEAQMKAAGIDPAQMEKPKATGKKEKVGDWDAEIYEGKFGPSDARFWVAKDYPNYKTIFDQMSKMSAATSGPSLDPSKFDFGGMVVKSEIGTPSGKVTTTLVRAKEEPVDASTFDIPKDYKEMPMPGL